MGEMKKVTAVYSVEMDASQLPLNPPDLARPRPLAPGSLEAEVLRAAARGDQVSEASGIDWERLLESAEAEGMIGLLGRAVGSSTVPAEIRRRLLIGRVSLETRAALMLEELARIVRTFETAGVRLLTFKGAPLSQQLYGEPGLRSFGDLDVLVSPRDAEHGERLLGELGYRNAEPLSARQASLHRRFNYESTFLHDAKTILVDFHWQVASVQFPLRLSFEDLWQRHVAAEIDGVSYPTPGPLDRTVMTTSHSAKHLWSKVEMLAQIAALARQDLDWERIENLAFESRAARQLGLSFLLARDLIGATMPPLKQSLARAEEVYPSVRALVEQNLTSRARRSDAAGLDHFLLFDRRSDALRSLSVAFFVPNQADWAGNRGAWGSAWVLRPFRLIGRRLRWNRK